MESKGTWISGAYSKRYFAGLVGSSRDLLWDEKLQLLQQYKRENGDCNVPRSYKVGDTVLGRWVDGQRQEYRRLKARKSSTMTPDRLEKLKDLGFDWDPLETHWNSQFQLLCKFKQKYGHCLVPERYVIDGNRIGRWVILQRHDFRKLQEGRPSAITSERIDKLDGIGFEWDPLEKQRAIYFDLLCRYKKEHGNCLVPKSFTMDGFNLAGWVNLQRQDYRRRREGLASPMTEQRIEQLEQIGFDWAPFETSWNSHFCLLERFQQEHGHCNVPKIHIAEGGNLGEWVSSQRKAYPKFLEGSPSSLTQERVDMLNKLGFVWYPSETTWNIKLALLCHFHKTYGHWRIPKNYIVNEINLGAWLARQKIQFLRSKEGKQTPLTEERLRKLEETGFRFDYEYSTISKSMPRSKHYN